MTVNHHGEPYKHTIQFIKTNLQLISIDKIYKKYTSKKSLDKDSIIGTLSNLPKTEKIHRNCLLQLLPRAIFTLQLSHPIYKELVSSPSTRN